MSGSMNDRFDAELLLMDRLLKAEERIRQLEVAICDFVYTERSVAKLEEALGPDVRRPKSDHPGPICLCPYHPGGWIEHNNGCPER